MHQQDLIRSLEKQNRLLKAVLGMGSLALTVTLLVAAKTQHVRFSDIDVERINIVTKNGKRELVIANSEQLPNPVTNGKEYQTNRRMPGLIFYNEAGDECGGLLWNGRLDAKGNPLGGGHFSMDRFGGDQQLVLSHYEEKNLMETGLNVFDRGESKSYQPLWDAMLKTPEGPEKEKLKHQWEEAGGRQTQRLFVGRTLGKSSAVVLSDAKGRARIMMYVTPEGKAVLKFLDENGGIIQSLPQAGPQN
jgi:hypothetical protein